jgi:hypothetical protein
MPDREVRVSYRSNDITCEWCSLPGTRYTRFVSGYAPATEWIELCDECAAMLVGAMESRKRQGMKL